VEERHRRPETPSRTLSYMSHTERRQKDRGRRTMRKAVRGPAGYTDGGARRALRRSRLSFSFLFFADTTHPQEGRDAPERRCSSPPAFMA